MARKERIAQLINNTLHPLHCIIEDETHLHHVPLDGETHFKLTIVADEFSSLKLVDRHKYLFELLHAEFKTGLHALSLKLYSPAEWEKQATIPPSPACRDGYDKED